MPSVLTGRPFDCGKIACAVNDTYDLSAVFSDAVKGEPSVDDQRSRVPVYLRTGPANLRMFPEQLAGLLDAVDNRDRRPSLSSARRQKARCRASLRVRGP